MMTHKLSQSIKKLAISARNGSEMALFNLKTPIMRISIIAVFVLAFSLLTMPITASADSTTTYYIPLPGYYLDANGQPLNGQSGYQYSCTNSICSPVNGGNATAGTGGTTNTTGTTPRYTACSTASCQYYSSQYPYPTYTPYVAQPSTLPNNQYQYQSYPYPVYVPYEKVGNTYQLGKPTTIPKYQYTIDGKLLNQTSAYGSPSYGTSGFIPTTGQSAYRSTGGFIMTNQGY